MKTIVCRKCGATIDASLGECPNCGALYYIIPEEMPSEQTPARDIFAESQQLDVEKADKDELFNVSSWKTGEDPDMTRAFRPPAQQPDRPEFEAPRPQPTRRPATQASNGRRNPPPPPPKKGLSTGKKRLIVAAVALVAVLTLIIALMSNAFDFNKNKDKLTMPSVLELTEESATTALEDMGLIVETETEHSDKPEGEVIGQSIKEGKLIKKGDKVVLTISSGPSEDDEPDEPETVTVPEVLGKSYDQAMRELTSLGLLVSRAEDQYSDKPAGQVIAQSPAKNTELEKGDNVVLTVSKGPEPSPSPTGFTITVTAGAGGTVSPKGAVKVEENGSQTFTITPNDGYEIREVKADGTNVGAVASYTFTNVTGDHTLYVVFQVKTNPTPTPTPAPTPTPIPTATPTAPPTTEPAE